MGKLKFIGAYNLGSSSDMGGLGNSPWAGAYYVDATYGNDANSGRSPHRAWRTIAKVNASTFQPGDHVLFRRGETFNVTASITGTSGVTYGAYGSGNKPVLDGQDLNNVFYLQNKDRIRLVNLDLRRGFDFCAYFDTCTNCHVVNCDTNRAGNDNINFIDGCSDCSVWGGTHQAPYERIPGPAPSCIEVADGSHDITIENVRCHSATGAASAGITIHSHVGTDMPYNITVRNANCFNNANYGLVIFNQNGTAGKGNTNIQIYDSTFDNNTLDNIRVTKAGAITEYPHGLILFDNCLSRNAGRYACWNEGDNCRYQDCLFHEGRMFYSRSSAGLVVYNCTFYLTTWGGYRTFTHDDASARGTTTILLRNNLVYMPDTAGSSIMGVLAGATAGADIDYTMLQMNAASNRWNWGGVNMNFATWQANADANGSCQANVLFTNPAGDDFTLQAASPAINAGIDVGLPYCQTAPDCGAYEYCP